MTQFQQWTGQAKLAVKGTVRELFLERLKLDLKVLSHEIFKLFFFLITKSVVFVKSLIVFKFFCRTFVV
jgi:hypothetical protein